MGHNLWIYHGSIILGGISHQSKAFTVNTDARAMTRGLGCSKLGEIEFEQIPTYYNWILTSTIPHLISLDALKILRHPCAKFGQCFLALSSEFVISVCTKAWYHRMHQPGRWSNTVGNPRGFRLLPSWHGAVENGERVTSGAYQIQ